MRNTQMASTTEYEDERVNLSKDAPKQARPRKKILVPPKPHEKRYSSFNKPQITLDTETTGLDPDKRPHSRDRLREAQRPRDLA